MLAVVIILSVILTFLVWRRQKMSKTVDRASDSVQSDHNSGQNASKSDQDSDDERAPLLDKS